MGKLEEFLDDVQRVCSKMRPEFELYKKYHAKEADLKAEMARKRKEFTKGSGIDSGMIDSTLEFLDVFEDIKKKLIKLKELQKDLLIKHRELLIETLEKIDLEIFDQCCEMGISAPDDLMQMYENYRQESKDVESEYDSADQQEAKMRLQVQAAIFKRFHRK